MLSIRSKTIIAIVAVILTISSAYLFFFLKQRDQSHHIVVQGKKEMVNALVTTMTRDMNQQYSSRIKTFINRHNEVVNYFAQGQKDKLYEVTLPAYNLLHAENTHFDHISFINPDGTVFLKMHAPAQTDDESYTCKAYTDLGDDTTSGISGFVFGKCGLLYRVTEPLHSQGKFIGSVLFGIRMESFIVEIRDSLNLHTAFALRKDLVDESEQKSEKFILDGDYVIYDLQDPFFHNKLGLMNKVDEEQRFINSGIIHYVFSSYTIRDYRGEEVGRIIHGLDMTDVFESYSKDTLRLIIITLAVIVLASCILYFAFSKLLGEMVALNKELSVKNDELVKAGKELEEEVLKRTAELGEANTQLIKEIGERQAANQSLIRSIEEWQGTFDAIADPVTILDRNLEVVIANKAAHDMLSQDDKEIVGRTCYELFAGNSEPCDSCPASDVFSIGVKKEYEVDHGHLGKSLLVSCSPIFDAGEISGYVHTAKDVTEEKVLKKQLSQAQKMEAIATLAGGIAHDFNNILGAILGNADLLLYRLAPPAGGASEQKKLSLTAEEIASHIEAIKKAGNRAKELVSQILAFSRQNKTQRQNVLITPVIKEGVKLLRSSLAANIEVKASVDPEACHINADLSQIHQVFMNLCTNAAQAMKKKGGVLEIDLQNFKADSGTRKIYPEVSAGKYLKLSVKDTGHGMSPEVMERIFDPFFTTRDVSEGTGMGLSVIHGIITAHQGFLDVKSEVGVGSEFSVFFPCIEAEKDVVDDPVLGVPRGKEKVLFVDDEADILKMSASMLEYLGYTVYPAISGEEALEKLKAGAADAELVICDYSMPGMSGTDLAREIEQMERKVPVILCSGFSESVVLDEQSKKVIRKFMSKPLDMKKLAMAIREVLS